MEIDDAIDRGDEVLVVGNIVYPVDATEVVSKVTGNSVDLVTDFIVDVFVDEP